jgi:LacI family transcriptional regulator
MPNQKDIANALGITQAAVSMALRGDRSISEDMRRKVFKKAVEMGYQPNAYLATWMSRVRTGKKSRDQAIIAMLIEAGSIKEWQTITAHRVFYEGAVQRATELGFSIEPFFLQQPEMNADKMDQILRARGIKGIILAPPYHGNRTLNLRWEQYAAVGVGIGWEKQELNRVAFDTLHNYIVAFENLRELGYRRIGTVLTEGYVRGNRRGMKCYTGYLECQDAIPKKNRIPIFTKDLPPEIPEAFEAWLAKWQPDVLLTMVGDEKLWLDSLGLKVPKDIGMACLAHPHNKSFARIDEKSEVVGASAAELVAAQIARSEFGPPTYPKTTLIEGQWIGGLTVRKQ